MKGLRELGLPSSLCTRFFSFNILVRSLVTYIAHHSCRTSILPEKRDEDRLLFIYLLGHMSYLFTNNRSIMYK